MCREEAEVAGTEWARREKWKVGVERGMPGRQGAGGASRRRA